MPSIDLDVSTRLAQRNLRQLGDEFEDLSDTLDDVARDGSRGGKKLEDALQDVAREASDTGRKIGTELDDGFDKARRGVDDFKSEANQTARESAASFDGSAQSIGDAFQEVAANAFSGFGPAGAAAGIVAAAGLGAALTAINEQNEAAQRLKDFLSEAYRTAADEGRKYLDVATIQAEAFDILFNSDRANERNRAEEQAVKIGLDANTVILARAGDQESLNAVIEATTRAQENLASKTQEQGSNAIRLSQDERNELSQIAREYEGLAAAHDDEARRAEQAQALKEQLQQKERDQIQKTRDADQQRWEAYAAARAQATGDVVQRVTMQVDDSAVRNYKAPELVIRTRLGAPKDVSWQ